MVEYCVCAEPIQERGVYPCSHALCLSCTLKKRVLMKDTTCPYCRAMGPHVAVVESANSSIEDATIDFKRFGITVETRDLAAQLSHILSFPCPECDEEQKSYKKLKPHLQKEHGKQLCDVCTKHQFVFSDEYQTFDSSKAYHKHLDKEHIKCKYCNQYFYSMSEFSKHCRQAHFGCEVCERRDPQHPKYFKTFDELFQHYTDKHHVCMVPACLDDKHIVFGTQMELQNHMLEAHPGLIGNRRDFQQVDLAQLSLSEADNIEQPSVDAEDQNTLSRYMARLDIVADHDAEKIEKLKAVNQTFLGKKVPVEVLIATYESVLKGVAAPQVTALLGAFNRAYAPKLAEETRRQLNFVLQRRAQAEDELVGIEKKAQEQALPSLSSLGPAPTRVQKMGWGSTPDEPRLRGTGLSGFGNLPQLPQLGQEGASAQKGAAPRNSYAAGAAQRKPSSQQLMGLNNRLPQLPKAKKQEQSVRQTSIPLASRSRLSYAQPSYSGWRPESSTDLSAPPLARADSGEASPRASPSLASSSSSSSIASSTQRKPNLNRLPSLPATKPAADQKKKKHNVIRIV